jgi:hypothetical protein
MWVNLLSVGGWDNVMALISSKNNKNTSGGLVSDERVEDDSSGRGFVKRSGKYEGTLTNRTGLINGLTIAEQDPSLKKAVKGTKGKKGKDEKRKVGASEALLKI